MTTPDYDIITVGGGLGGSALAKVMAEQGARVLVLEKATAFKDRVRGEVLVPWGCVEARKLGLYDLLHDACGHEIPMWASDLYGMQFLARNMVETLDCAMPVLTFYHPTMQELIARAAADAGAHVVYGASMKTVTPGEVPAVAYEHDGALVTATARMVVAADGRGSAVRKAAGFEVRQERQRRFFGGVLMDGVKAPEDTMYSRFAPNEGLMSWIFPQGGGRARTYIGYHAASDFQRLNGERDVPRFIETARRIGVPEECFANAEVAGPLATFDATDNWVEHPYANGVALIGDAASTSDPTWGQGMSLALRDVRVLSEKLAAHDDWDEAGHAYAVERKAGYDAIRTVDSWYTDILLEIGPEAEARRERALPLLAEDATRIPDTPLGGPELGAGDEMRRRFFGEDA